MSARASDPKADEPTIAAVVRQQTGVAWSRARGLCMEGRVTLNGERCLDPASRVSPGTVVAVDQHARKLPTGPLAGSAIVFCDQDVVVVDKPAGMLSVADEPGNKDTLVDHTRTLLRQMGRRGVDAKLGVVHRLDRDTSGLMMFTRTAEAKRMLAAQFRDHTIDRVYHAIAHGAVARTRVETHLVLDRGDGLRGSLEHLRASRSGVRPWGGPAGSLEHFRASRSGIRPGSSNGYLRRPSGEATQDARRSVTHVTPIEQLIGATLVECRLETGRQHQIRIHLSELGHPLVGERVYIRDYAGPKLEAVRPMLHARTLGFAHPRTGERIAFDREPPADFQAALQSLRPAHR